MRKVNKDYNNVPDSLQIPNNENFTNSIPRASKTTDEKRHDLIKADMYIDEKSYNSRYKGKDVKEKLKEIYIGKCAYCENTVEMYHVEHYRPKSRYYWLAFSWDNLLLACGYCNIYKGENFEIDGVRKTFDQDDYKHDQVNTLSAEYNQIERPKLIQPELDDIASLVFFDQDGSINSTDTRVIYTIETCKLNRNYLKDLRRKIVNDFRNDITSIMVECNDTEEQLIGLRTLTRKFINDSNNLSNPFTMFRRFISNNYVKSIIKEIKNSAPYSTPP